MIINRKENYNKSSYDYQIKEEDKILNIYTLGNLDLYFQLITKDEKDTSIDITKELMELYQLFDKLYEDIIAGRVNENITGFSGLESKKDFRETKEYKALVHDNVIVWKSDNDREDNANIMTIEKQEDCFHIEFYKKNKDDVFEDAKDINIRIRNSGSRYRLFNNIFMMLYRRMQQVDPDYLQLTLEEVAYTEKVKQKKQ